MIACCVTNASWTSPDSTSAATLCGGPGAFARVGSGLAVELPEGYELQVRPRSGVAASHSPLLRQLSETIREPFRTALLCTSRVRSSVVLSIEANGELLRAIRAHDPLAARRAAEQAVGFAMLAAEEIVRAESAPKRRKAPR